MLPKAHGKYQERGRSGLQVEQWLENNKNKLGASPGAQNSHHGQINFYASIFLF